MYRWPLRQAGCVWQAASSNRRIDAPRHIRQLPRRDRWCAECPQAPPAAVSGLAYRQSTAGPGQAQARPSPRHRSSRLPPHPMTDTRQSDHHCQAGPKAGAADRQQSPSTPPDMPSGQRTAYVPDQAPARRQAPNRGNQPQAANAAASSARQAWPPDAANGQISACGRTPS